MPVVFSPHRLQYVRLRIFIPVPVPISNTDVGPVTGARKGLSENANRKV